MHDANALCLGKCFVSRIRGVRGVHRCAYPIWIFSRSCLFQQRGGEARELRRHARDGDGEPYVVGHPKPDNDLAAKKAAPKKAAPKKAVPKAKKAAPKKAAPKAKKAAPKANKAAPKK